MDEYFCLRSVGPGGEDLYMDAPRCEHGCKVIAYQHLHGGDNQQWHYRDRKIISLFLSPEYCLSIREIKHNSSVTLSCTSEEDEFCYNEWVFEDDSIKLKADENFCIGISNNELVLQGIAENGATAWFREVCESTSKPATSCHLNYKPVPDMEDFDSWALENTVCVRKSYNTTYFCILGWGPGGYSGIQQIDEFRRVTIFSMWNEGRHSVRLIEAGAGVEVTAFGGEGTGLKSMKDVHWDDGQRISFKVTGNRYDKVGDKSAVWICSGWYRVEDGEWNLMATYERTGDLPFKGHFYSFVEDWDRSTDAEGNKLMRCAEFSNPMLCLPDDRVILFERAIFTKQTKGADKFGMNKAFGGIKKCRPSFILSTGGESVESIEQYLHAQE